MGKAVTWGGAAFLIFFVSQRPSAAVDIVHAAVDLTMSVAHGFADFAGSLI